MTVLYDRIGGGSTATRREDPRLAARIRAALGPGVRTVVNVGAGAGAYEPRDPEVTAVEPSATMIAQRPPTRRRWSGRARRRCRSPTARSTRRWRC